MSTNYPALISLAVMVGTLILAAFFTAYYFEQIESKKTVLKK